MTMGTDITKEKISVTIQKHLINFCKVLPFHVDTWQELLREVEKPVQALVNYSEQLRHVERANIKYIDGFKDLQDKVLYKIYSELEDELALIKGVVEKLCSSNQDLRNKLITFEKSTIDLNWEEETPLINGTAFQPPLSRILQEGYDYMMFFTQSLKCINESIKNLNVRNEKTMYNFESNFKLDLDNKTVRNLLAIVQYVGHNKAVI